MDVTELMPHIEALIFASDKPLTELEITDLINNAFGFMEDKITLDQIEAGINGVKEKYTSEFYPFEVIQSGGGWQFLTKKEYHKTVAQLNGDKFMKRLSAAALETLAIVAYKQPVTKGEVEAIRGVSADYAIQKLLEKELIIISGRNEKLPGHPLVYTTSKSFMDYFGINSSDELPKIKEVLAEQFVEPTNVNEAMTQNEKATDEAANPLAVSDKGQLIENDTIISETVMEEEQIENNLVDEIDLPGEEEEIPLDDEKKQVTEENPGGIEEEEGEDDEDRKQDDNSEPDY